MYDAKEVIACGKDGEPEPIQKLQDLVNKWVKLWKSLSSAISFASSFLFFGRTTWKKCCFSGDGEYVCAGSARQHALYVWEKSVGNLVKILHGTKGELLLDVVWHPVRPIITSISSGLVSIWAQNQVENWSAFAPDFKELDENVEYEERESEFDIEDEDKSVDLSAEAKHDEEIEVDVVKVDPIAAFCSSDEEYEEDAGLQFLPMAPEVEDPEDGWNQENSNGGGPEKANPKDNDEPMETDDSTMATANNSAMRKKANTYEIQLDAPPKDGSYRKIGWWEMIFYVFFLSLSISEVHPLLLNRSNKDKQGQMAKKAAGRPRK